MLKKIVSCVLVLLVLSLPMAYAENTNLETPGSGSTAKWSYTSSTKTILSISSAGKATCTGSLIGYQGTTTGVDIFLYLERYINGSWSTYPSGSWYQYFPTYQGVLSATIYVTSGYNYRLRASYYANSGSNWENISSCSQTVYY